MRKLDQIEILDCTVRDGGYVNNWDFDKKHVRETYRSLSKAGIDYVELGYHGSEKYFDRSKYGSFRFCDPQDLNWICSGIEGAKVSLMVDFGKYDLADLLNYKNINVDLIRLAFHKNMIKPALVMAKKIKKIGFKVSLNMMGFSSYSENEKQELLLMLKDLPLDYAYVADSYGSMFPDQVKKFFEPLLKMDHIKWGFHPHNNLQMAFANTLAALEVGASIVDCSIYGMGRGAGNLPTEILLAYLCAKKPQKYNVIPILNIIDHYFAELRNRYKWGHDLPYMLSGILGCHPDYAKNLVDRKEYDIEDISKILEIVKNTDPIGFNRGLIDEIVSKGFFGKSKSIMAANPSVKRKRTRRKVEVGYLDKHHGKDILVLGNGTTLEKNRLQIAAFIEKYDPVVLGANYLGGMFVPYYHVFTNKKRFIDYVEFVDIRSKLLIGQYIPNKMIREYTGREYETLYYDDNSDSEFNISNGVVTSNCRTVSVLLIAVAIIMGAKRIFVAGLDGYLDVKGRSNVHFYAEKDETENREMLLDKHWGNMRYLEQIDDYLIREGKEGIHVLTPTSYSKYYKGIDNYLKSEK